MFLPIRLLALELKRSGCYKQFLHYQSALIKVERNSLRIKFLENCKRADVIPKFLKFRVPNNGCFDERSIHDFQRKLLHKELQKAKNDLKMLNDKLDEKRHLLRTTAPGKCLPSVILHTRQMRILTRQEQLRTHNHKLTRLSEDQERPLFNVQNTVVTFGLETPPPSYIMETLSLGPKNAVLDRFDPKEVLAEIDELLHHCKENQVSEETITDINVKTLAYIKRCKRMKTSRNVQMTKKYLKDHGLLAIPFDKGVGICIMKQEDYHAKMDAIIQLPQFEKYVKPRKNAKHPVLKEQERIHEILKSLRNDGKIDEVLFQQLKPRGSQPARLYGLAKVHKNNTPVRPVLSMPGSAYHKVANFVAKAYSAVPNCKINASSMMISEKIREVLLEKNEELISFDVVSLYTNVPVLEAIDVCTEMLYNLPEVDRPSIDKDTFLILAKIASCEVLMLTHDGYYVQKDGLAMGSPPAPHLANGWLSQYDGVIKGDSKLYFRYMDDILMEQKTNDIEQKLTDINILHENLKFTLEREKDEELPVLDMKLHHDHSTGMLSSTWYTKPTDTGLIMNFHALAPKRYKRSVVTGFVYRIHRSCSTWKNFHVSLEKAKKILEKNQYPPPFYEPLINQALCDILKVDRSEPQLPHTTDQSSIKKIKVRIQYRGKGTEDYARALHKLNAPCMLVMTLRKLKTVLPSLKPPVEKMLKSGVVYQLTCPRCLACYVGETCRHMQTRLKEHHQKAGPMKIHLAQCSTTIPEENVKILHSTTRGEEYLLTLEALHIREQKPALNTKDEYKRKELIIKL